MAEVRRLSAAPPLAGALRGLLPDLRPHTPALAAAVAVVLVGTGATALVPPLLAAGIDAAAVGSLPGLHRAAVLGFALAVGIAVAQWSGDRMLAAATERVLAGVRDRVAAGLARAPLRVLEAHRGGELVSRAGTEVERLASVVRVLLPAVLANVGYLTVAAVVLTVASWELTLVLLAGLVPAGALVMRSFHRSSAAAFAAEAQQLGTVSATFAEAFTAREALQRANATGAWTGRHRADCAALLVAVRRTVAALNRLPWMVLVECAVTALLLVAGGVLVQADRVPVGVVVVFVLSSRLLFDSFTQTTGLVGELQDGRVVLARLRDLLEVTEHPVPAAAAVPARGVLEATGVGFGYRPGADVLAGVDLRIGPGDRVAVVGGTGAGKSTLVGLLGGLRTPDRGSVRFAGTDLAELDRGTLRRRIVLVVQRPFLVPGSLRDNLRLVPDPPDDDRLAAAASDLGLSGWVAGLGGLGAPIEGGLSAGERQLVGLLRAAVLDPAVLLLDEATADLDPRTAARIEAALVRLAVGRALVVVAHRPATVARLARRILVAAGTVTEIDPRRYTPMRNFRAVVQRSRYVTPRTVRVTLGGPDLAGFATSGRPDEYTDVFLPGPGETEPVLPIEVGGLQTTPDGRPESDHRHYTIRGHDPGRGEVELDVVVHEGGIGAAWGARTGPGDVVGIGEPGGGTWDPPPDAAWRLLVGDATALPAIGRIVEGLGPGERAHVIAVVADADEHQEWATPGEVTVDWRHEPAPERIGDALLAALRGYERPPGTGYTWMAGENVATRLGRRFLRHELGLPRTAYATLGYWRVDEERWMERYTRLQPELDARIDAAEREHADTEDLIDAVETIYEDAGL